MKNNLMPIRVSGGWKVTWNNLVEDGSNHAEDLFNAVYKDTPFFIDIGCYGKEFMALYAKDWENEDSIIRDMTSTNLVKVIAKVEDWMINYYHEEVQ